MPQESLSLENTKMAKPLAPQWQGGGLKAKIVTTFSGLILALGLLVSGIVYYLTGNALQRQVDLRATAIATTLSDAAAGYVLRKNALELDALIAKYGRLDGVGYAYIQDPKGAVLATSAQPFPEELKETSASESRAASRSRITKLRGRSVFETQVPLLDGQLGTVYVGLWADAVEQDVHGTVLPIVGLIGICLVAGIALSVMLASKMVRPILQLKSIADDISRGHLDTSVSIQTNDEVGELAQSLERMRASLRAAMIRLNRE